VDDLIAKSMDQHFAQGHEELSQQGRRFNGRSEFTASESQQTFLLQKTLLGATAQNLLEKEGLADTLLQLKGAGTFPPNQLGQGSGPVQ